MIRKSQIDKAKWRLNYYKKSTGYCEIYNFKLCQVILARVRRTDERKYSIVSS